jgi:hypothetical protein
MMNLIILLLSMVLGNEPAAESSASIVLRGGILGGEPGILPPGSFDLGFDEAWVAQGSYSGIRVTFKTQGQGADHHQLTLFIPCHSDFSVGYDSSRGEFISRIPTTPFTFHAEKSAGMKDRFGRPRPMKVEFTHWKKSGKQSWSPRSIEFTDCEIKVETMFIKEHKLTFSGSFECSSKETDYNASGRFAVNGGELGVSKVD